MTFVKSSTARSPLAAQPLLLALLILTLALFASLASAQSGSLPSPSGNDLITGTTTDTGGGGAMPPPLKKDSGGATPPPLPTLNIFVALNGEPSGPFNQAQLQQMATAGQLNPQTLVWKEGMADWAPAGGVAELQAIIQVPAPGPGPKPDPTKPMDAARYLTGLWTVPNGKMPVGAQQATFSGNINYQADGTYSAKVEMSTLGGGGQMPDTYDVTAKGTWTATMLGSDRISVSSVDDIAMTSKITGQTQQAQSSDTAIYSIVDQNTLRDEFGNAMQRMQ